MLFERDCALCKGAHSLQTLLPPVVLYRHHSISFPTTARKDKQKNTRLSLSLSLSSVQTKNSNKRLDTRNLGASKVGLTYTYTQTVAFPSPNVFAQNFGLLLFFLATDKPLQKAFITVSGEKVTKTKGKQSTAFPKPSSITKPSRAETRHTSQANPRAQTLCAH